MQNRIHILLLQLGLVLVLSFCKEPEKTKIPDNILPPDRMISIMTDVSIVESAVNVNHLGVAIAGVDTSLRFNVYKQNGITRAMYDSSIAFYSKHPAEFKEIYDKVIEKLGKMQGQ